MSLFVILALPFVGGLISSLLSSRPRKLQAPLAGMVALTCALFTLANFSGDLT